MAYWSNVSACKTILTYNLCLNMSTTLTILISTIALHSWVFFFILTFKPHGNILSTLLFLHRVADYNTLAKANV